MEGNKIRTAPFRMVRNKVLKNSDPFSMGANMVRTVPLEWGIRY